MDSIVQFILNRSKLELLHIKITKATKDTFSMAIECRVTDTGPLGATLAPMTVDMVGPKGIFGRVGLPQVKTASTGVVVEVPDQLIDILDMEAFLAFTASIMRDDELTVTLDNGKGVVKALMMSANILYKKDVVIRAMGGPQSELRNVAKEGDGYTAEVLVHNPSPVEIDLGSTIWEIRTEDGKKLAEHRGKTWLKRGDTSFAVTGKIEPGATLEGTKAKLIGAGTEEDAWTKDSMKAFEIPIELPAEFIALLKA